MLDLDAELEEYIGLHSEPEPEILQQLSRATHQKILRPRMLSGNLQGQFLKMLCRMNRVQRVLEIGTFTGYAAISMAMGMGEKGVLHTIDINDEIEDFTRNYIERSGLAGQIVLNESHLCFRVAGDYDAIRQYHKEMNCVCFENTAMGLYFINDPDDYWIEILPQ